MTFNPVKLIRRRKRLHQAIHEEVHFLMRSYGAGAHSAALEKLQRPDLTNWGRQVLDGAARRLERGEHPVAPTGTGLESAHRWLRQAMTVLKLDKAPQ